MTVTPVRRFAHQLGIAIAVVIATAVMDLGPRASAAYISMADVTEGGGTCTSADHQTDEQRNLTPDREPDGKIPVDAHLQGGSGMSAPSSSSSSGSVPVVGALTPIDLPPGGLVVFFREPAASIHLSAFIDSILDPPRQA